MHLLPADTYKKYLKQQYILAGVILDFAENLKTWNVAPQNVI